MLLVVVFVIFALLVIAGGFGILRRLVMNKWAWVAFSLIVLWSLFH
jgi:hypothetical protein